MRTAPMLRQLALWVGRPVVLGASFVVSLIAQTPATAPRPSAQTLVADAIKTAKSEHKVVLVTFGASWCGPCHQLLAFLHAPVVRDVMSDNYVIVNLTVLEMPALKALENPGGNDLLKAMNGIDNGIPFYYFVDTAGVKLADSNGGEVGYPSTRYSSNLGYPATPLEIDAFDKLLQKTAPRMTAAQRAQIREYLTTHLGG